MSIMNRQSSVSKVLLLATLSVYTSCAAALMHRSRALPKEELYSPASSVLMGEAAKIVISVVLAKHSTPQDSLSDALDCTRSKYRRSLLSCFIPYYTTLLSLVTAKDAWKLSIPAGLYVLQNLLQLTSMTALTPLTYQTLSQFKIAAVAMFSTILMGKKLTFRHWVCIITLLGGVVAVQVHDSGAEMDIIHYARQASDLLMERPHLVMLMQFVAGPAMLLLSVCIGSLSGVILERIVKADTRSGSLWRCNAQLSFYSLAPCLFLVAADCVSRKDINFLHHFGRWAWLTVATRAVGGILVALVLKHADNILKAFATSAAIVLSIVWASVADQSIPSIHFILSAGMVVFSTVAYALVEHDARQRLNITVANEKTSFFEKKYDVDIESSG